MTVKEIANFANVDRSTVTRHIEKMNIWSLSKTLKMSTSNNPADFSRDETDLILKEMTHRKTPKHFEQHGMSLSREYDVWRCMKRRCYNKKKVYYKRYGGRGIKVCERWKTSFMSFYEDMGRIPFEGAQIDRVDNDGDYEPSNCRWTTQLINIRNSSATKITMGDANEIRILSCLKLQQKEIASLYGINYRQVSLISRLKYWKYKDTSGRYIS